MVRDTAGENGPGGAGSDDERPPSDAADGAGQTDNQRDTGPCEVGDPTGVGRLAAALSIRDGVDHPGADTGDDETSSGVGPSVSRRSVLLTAGAATATLSGCVGSSSEPVRVESVEAYGYGGSLAMRQSARTLSVGESEPNDGRRQAVPISLNTTVRGDLDRRESDWFAVSLPADRQVEIRFDRVSRGGIVTVLAYDPDGELLEMVHTAGTGPSLLHLSPGTAGRHYLQIRPYAGGPQLARQRVDRPTSRTGFGDGYALRVAAGDGSASSPTNGPSGDGNGNGGRESSTETATPTQTDTATSTPTDTLTATDSATPTSTPTATDSTTPTATATPTPEDDYGEQSYGEYGYGGVSA